MAKNIKGREIPELFPDKCIGCQLCMAECPMGAIKMTDDGVAEIDPEICVGCGMCPEVCPSGAIRFEQTKRRKAPAEKPKEEPAVKPAAARVGVAVFIETFRDGGSAAPVSWELMGKARELADKLHAKVLGFLLSGNPASIAKEAIAYGCDEVHVIDHPMLREYLSAPFGKALADLCEEVKPEILLIGATYLGRDLAGIVATRLETGLTADCTSLGVDEESGLLLMTRPTFGGNILATIFCEHRRPQMSTVRPKVLRMPARDETRQGGIFVHDWTPPEGPLPEIVEFRREVTEMGSVDITRAATLIVAGKGACDVASLALLQELADLLGGVVACSRPVVESGMLPYQRQVGQTGKTVAPGLYIGVAVSGAIQHLVAIQGAEKIVAINSDPNAPIFKAADVGIVGDYHKVIPELISQLRKRFQERGEGLPHGKI